MEEGQAERHVLSGHQLTIINARRQLAYYA